MDSKLLNATAKKQNSRNELQDRICHQITNKQVTKHKMIIPGDPVTILNEGDPLHVYIY